MSARRRTDAAPRAERRVIARVQRLAGAVLGPSTSFRGVMLFGTGTRLFALGAQFVVLVVLARVLSKGAFGDAMTVFAFYRIGSLGLGTGLSYVILYHVSRTPDDKVAEIRFHRTVAAVGAAIGIAIAVLVALAAPLIATGVFGKPSLAPWFVSFAPFMVFSTLITVATGALDGRSRITESLMVSEAAPNALRLALLPIGALLALPDTMVAHVMTLSVALPWLWTARRLLDRSVQGFAPLRRWDASYAAKFVLFSFSSLTLQGFDMLVVGALFSSETVADYAVASRLAVLYPFFQQIVVRRFSPTAGRLLHLGDHQRLQEEVDACRRASIIAVAISIAAIIGPLPLALQLLGNYHDAIPIAILLALPPTIRSVYASVDRVLQMAGYANWALAIQLTALSTVILFPLATHQVLGVASIPIAMTLASLALNPISSTVLRRRLDVKTIGARDIVLVAVAGAAVFVAVALPAGWLPSLVVAVTYLGIAAGTYLISRKGSVAGLTGERQSTAEGR